MELIKKILTGKITMCDNDKCEFRNNCNRYFTDEIRKLTEEKGVGINIITFDCAYLMKEKEIK